MTTAVIFVPNGQYELYASLCLNYCVAKGYEIGGVIQGDWEAVVRTISAGIATVVVVARPEHINPAWEPRIEIAGTATIDQPDNDRARSMRRRRPRPI